MLLATPLLFLSLSLNAQSPASFSKISEGIYVHTSFQNLGGQPFPSNGLIVETKSSVFLVDTGWGLDATQQVYKWVDENLNKKVVACIVTHFHDDRVSGAPWLQEQGVKIFAHTKTDPLMAKDGFGNADVLLPVDSLFYIEEVAVHTFYPGEGHSPDNIVVWLPASKVLFGGCLVKSTEAKGMGNLSHANIKAWPQTIKTVMKKFPEAALVVPGHQSWLQKNSLAHTLQLLEKHSKKSN